MTPWSAPTPGHTIAELTSGTDIHAGPGVSGIVEAMLRKQEQDRAQIAQAGQTVIGGVAGYMKQQKSDQIAQTLLDQASNYDNETPTDTEAVARALNESEARPTDAWAAYNQSAKTAAIAEKLKGRSQTPSVPIKDEASGLVWNGRQWTHPVGSGKPANTQADTQEALDAEIQKKFGATGQELLEAASAGKVQSSGDPDKADPKDVLTVSLADGRVITAKRSAFAPYINRAMALQKKPAETGGGDDISTLLEKGPASIASQNEVVRTTKDGKKAIFDASTKQFLRWADDASNQ